MKHRFEKHHTGQNGSLSALFDRCGHYLAHRIGGSRRGRENIMTVIARQPGISQKELAEALGIQPASVSELLMKLEHKGLISREKDAQDRRSMKVQLTEAGQAHLAEPREEETDPFQTLTEAEQDLLREILEKLLADWEQRYPAERHHKHHQERSHHHGKHE